MNDITHKKILVAEDEADLREALQVVLETEGFSVITAGDGVTALNFARTENPDLVLLDLMMPGMSGKEVLMTLREDPAYVNMKFLILTAMSDLESLSEILEQGGFDYMVKSDWQLEDIVRKVKEKIGV